MTPEPIAYAAVATDASESIYARPTLTDAEREAVELAYDLLYERACQLQASGNIAASTPFVQSARALQGLWLRKEAGESQ